MLIANIVLIAALVGVAIVLLGIVAMFFAFYKKVPHGKALVRTGMGGTKVAFNGLFVIPAIHRHEVMDVSVKSLEIVRMSDQGLICKDNIRADIKVAFFIRVNNTVEDVTEVAQTIGCARASDPETLSSLFDAKFSEALKTVGKRMEFIELYDQREKFRKAILDSIGTDLNGYSLDNCAIDYLEQTPIKFLKEDNILDAEGIKKITELTATQKILANQIRREEEKTLTQQNTAAKEKILELQRQLRESEEKQAREVAEIEAKERAEAELARQRERIRTENARIEADEEINIREINKQRQIIVANKSREKTEAIEYERVQKEKLLEQTERERVVELALIEKQKAIEEERKQIQDVIRERVHVEHAVVSEEEKIKDTRVKAEAERKRVAALIEAEQKAEEARIQNVKVAEAQMQAAELAAKQRLIEAEAKIQAASKEAAAKKQLAEATVVETAAAGLAEVQVLEAKALALEKQGLVDAKLIEAKAEALQKQGLVDANVLLEKGKAEAAVIEQKLLAEAKGTEAKAGAEKATGFAEAEVLAEKGKAEAQVVEQRGKAEAQSIEQKAVAMQKLDGVGRDHEEFKLRLQRDLEIELARINVAKEVASAQASVLAEAFKNAKIDIVGGETMFFEKLVGAITNSRALEAYVQNSPTIQDVKTSLLQSGEGDLLANVRGLAQRLGVKTEDVKNLALSVLLMQLTEKATQPEDRSLLGNLVEKVRTLGLGSQTLSSLGLA